MRDRRSPTLRFLYGYPEGQASSQKTGARRELDGYSSYGNQIGLATGYVKEIYHPNYVAEAYGNRALSWALPQKNVIRETRPRRYHHPPGRTHRQGRLAAAQLVSSKVYIRRNVMKPAAQRCRRAMLPTGNKMQRLFRGQRSSRLIKKMQTTSAQAAYPLPSASWLTAFAWIWTRCLRNMQGLDWHGACFPNLRKE